MARASYATSFAIYFAYVSNPRGSTHRQNKSQTTSHMTREPSRKSPRKDKANISYKIVNEVSC